VSLEAWSDGALTVAMCIETLLQEFLCENTHLWKAIHSFLIFYVDKSIGGGFVGEVVHGDELFREVLDFYVHVFWACHWCHEVEMYSLFKRPPVHFAGR